ncbi:mechanosensitive ion channel domain-containing protein [Parapedobacter lycopersici]|uniref:mechanosensitive ion channel family protein n=1 Tax=Parapedobacter lycopersici TaxID=1864939 RepID=UPI003342DCA0
MGLLAATDPTQIYQFTYQLLLNWGLPETAARYLNLFIQLGLFFVVLWAVYAISRGVLRSLLGRMARNTKTKFDDYLINNRAPAKLARIIPLSLASSLIPAVLTGFPGWISIAGKLIGILLVFAWIAFFRSLFRSVRDHLRTKASFQDKPLESYLQVIDIFLFFIAGIILFTALTGQSPWAFLTAMGAASAILMLVFKDTILGFVASIQVSTNDMVRVGDWIEMPKYGADGDVVEINLNTVKVRNWDKTISTIPTYYLITDSVKNWRGMQETGGRRIKRAIHIKISSIRYVTPEELTELRKIQLLTDYIDGRQQEIDKFNAESGADRTMPVNGRNMTNVGLFRQYINRYAEVNPQIRKDMTFLVRQLSPSEHGLPIELYMFTADTRWAVYEGIMADLFDHLLSAIKYFNLEVFESPASDDIRNLRLQALKQETEAGPQQR